MTYPWLYLIMSLNRRAPYSIPAATSPGGSFSRAVAVGTTMFLMRFLPPFCPNRPRAARKIWTSRGLYALALMGCVRGERWTYCSFHGA